LPDVQPLSLGGRDAAAQPDRRHEVAAGHLYHPLQSPHKEFGKLFSGRYKSLIVDGSGSGYLKSVCDYVHLNPVRAGLLQPKALLESYLWSSYGQYLNAPGKRAGWMRADRLLSEWGIPKDSPAGRKRFAQCMEHHRRHESPDADWKAVERGWFLGDKAFKEELLAQMRERRKDHYGPELREAGALWRIDREFEVPDSCNRRTDPGHHNPGVEKGVTHNCIGCGNESAGVGLGM